MSALAAVLKETQILKLECAATPSVFAYVSAPIDTPTLSPPQPHPCRSISNNEIGAEGASALAAVLKETQITTLR